MASVLLYPLVRCSFSLFSLPSFEGHHDWEPFMLTLECVISCEWTVSWAEDDEVSVQNSTLVRKTPLKPQGWLFIMPSVHFLPGGISLERYLWIVGCHMMIAFFLEMHCRIFVLDKRFHSSGFQFLHSGKKRWFQWWHLVRCLGPHHSVPLMGASVLSWRAETLKLACLSLNTYFLFGCPQADSLTTLCLHLLIYKMGEIIASTQ